jgi:TonB family protein
MGQAQQSGQTQAKAESQGPRILRIGIVQGGKIVEERLVRKRADVTIGQSSKNTFVVPASNAVPRTFTLFEVSGNTYALNFTDGMDGRIAADHNTAPLALAQLRSRAQKRGQVYHLPLSDRSRGKVVIGDLTVLYQFVTPPPVQPRPQLPPSVRGSITQNLDWMLIAIVSLSLFGHVGFVLYLRQLDWPRKPDIEEIPDRFVQMIVPKKEEKPVVAKVDPNATKAKDEGKDAGKKKGGEKKGPAKPRDPEAEARAAAERRAHLAKELQSVGMLKVLSAKGEGGTVQDLIKGGDPGGDADRVFATVGGVGVASGGAGTGLRSAKGAGGSGTVKGIGGLRGTQVASVGTGERGAEKAATLKGTVKDSAPADIDGSLDAQAVINVVRRGKGGIIACYEHALKMNPNLSGKVELQFTISSVGKVSSAEIGNDTLGDDSVNKCIVGLVKSWRFPAPEGGDAHFAYPFVFQASK